MGIEPPSRHALARKSFENRIKVVLDIWAFQYAKQWPAHKAAFGKDRLFEAEILELFVNGVLSLDNEKDPKERRRKFRDAKWLRYERARFPLGIANFVRKNIEGQRYFGSLLGELDSLRQGALDADFKKMQAKIVLPNSKREINLLRRRETLDANGSLLAHALLNAMGIYQLKIKSTVNGNGQLVLAQ